MHRPLLITVFLAACLLGACAADGTKLVSSWKDPAYGAQPLRKVMIFVLSPEPEQRRYAEDQAARRFPSGTRAVASHTQFPDLGVSREEVRARLRDAGFDGALVARLVATDKSETYVPPATTTRAIPLGPSPMGYAGAVPYRSLNGYYGYAVTQVTTPGYIREDTMVLVETLLYTVAGGEPVWSAVSETFNPASTRETVDSVLEVVLRELSGRGLIGAAPGR